ncbi:MAG: hypothetical protein ACREXY_03180 [Gammaproteobacteria bacterium]
MAGIVIDPDQYIACTDFFDSEQWMYFQAKLNNAGRVFKELCTKHGFIPIRDSRWPTRGLFTRKWLTETGIRIALNARYIDETSDERGKEFYELHVSSDILVSVLSNGKTNYKCLRRYDAERINANELIRGDLEPLARELAEVGRLLGPPRG